MRSLTYLLLVVVLGVSSTANANPNPKAAAHYKQGKAFLDAKQYDRAIVEFLAAHAIDKVSFHLFNIADAYDAKGDHDKALEFFQKYLDADDKGQHAVEARARIVTATQKRDTALAKKKADDEVARQTAEKQRLDAENRRIQATGHVKQAEAYARANAWVDAGNEYRAAFGSDGDPAHLIAAGDAYRKAPDLEKARGAYGAYLEKVPMGGDSDSVRAKLAETKAIEQPIAEEVTIAPRIVPGANRTPSQPKDSESRHPRATAGIALTIVGLAGVAGSVVVGLQAKAAWDGSEEFCTEEGCFMAGLELVDKATSRANLATAIGIGGAVVAITGLVLFKSAPSAKASSSARIAPNVKAPGFVVFGSF